MRIIRLNNNGPVYTCNVYLVLGAWGALEDVNSLVDTGSDGSLLDEVEKIYTGVGKNKVDRVVLTHSHFDHAGGLSAVVQRYRPEVYAFTDLGVRNNSLYNGQIIRLGDSDFEVLHAPMHSNDSICLYCAKDGVLFSGDTPLHIKSPGGSYTAAFVDLLERLASLRIKAVYSGHGVPVTAQAAEMICHTLLNVRKSSVV